MSKSRKKPEEPSKKTSKNSVSLPWQTKESLIYASSSGIEPSSKILALDLDGTIVKTKSGATFPQDTSDWVFWDEKVPEKLQKWQKKGFNLVIFTNQGGISKGCC